MYHVLQSAVLRDSETFKFNPESVATLIGTIQKEGILL